MNKPELREFFDEYLQEAFALELIDYKLLEAVGKESKIDINVKECGKPKAVSGIGIGLLDSAYNALFGNYRENFVSLKDLVLHDAYFQIDHKAAILKSNMKLKIQFVNSRGRITDFACKESSVGLIGVSALVNALEFYINCELLFKRMRFLDKEATDRGRSDVASRYKYVLGQVVEVASYKTVAQDN